MAYHSPTHLLDPTTIPQQPQELIQEWTLRNLSLATTTIEDTIKFLVKHKLLANCSTCTACNRLRTIHQDHTKSDSIIWDCPNRQCRSKKSIREGSFFSGSQLSLVKVLTFIYCWTEEYPLFRCSRESGGMAEHTQTHWGLMCRGVCEDWLIQHSTQIGMCNVVQLRWPPPPPPLSLSCAPRMQDSQSCFLQVIFVIFRRHHCGWESQHHSKDC